MTIKEAIDKADRFKPNQYTDEEKTIWLSQLDFQIYFNVLCEHLPIPEDGFVPYIVEDCDNDLLVDAPFDELYVDYLKMKIDEANEETERYNNSAVLFNAKYDAFAKHYHKTHKPVMRTKFRFW